ncbi:MAG: sigma-70 family RNA polymerase sigma factor [Acidobacteriota bacterium]|nr:sigma-70 family RNA polymerase sigma factor [Acidobacteriota bacterium]
MMPVVKPSQMTELLIKWSNGDQSALDKLMPLVNEELRRLAHHYMRRERRGHTLQTSALVNEVYLRLVDMKSMSFESRAHFFGIAARAMRQILVEYARERGAAKRGGALARVELSEVALVSENPSADLIALDEALSELALFDERLSRVVELRFFGGLSVKEIAEVMRVHANTVIKDWSLAKAWLRRRLTRGETSA